jgi:hypothetical protein
MSVAINLIAIFSPFQQFLPHFTKDYYTTEKAQSTDEKIPHETVHGESGEFTSCQCLLI